MANINPENTTSLSSAQDQLVHILKGLYFAKIYLEIESDDSDAEALLERVTNMAHSIGVRLKANHYIIHTPEGEIVARGPDARAFAWAIAQTIGFITDEDIEDNYLNGLASGDIENPTAKPPVPNSELKKAFHGALSRIDRGECNQTKEDSDEPLCNRFVLALVNTLYVTSHSWEDYPAYIWRMDEDRTYLQSMLARMQLGSGRIAKIMYDELISGIGTEFSPASGPELWCRTDRWVHLPESCPVAGEELSTLHNGLDFLQFDAALKAGAVLN